MSTKDYYERYWSPEGFAPRGNLSPALRKLLDAEVVCSSDCLDVGCGDGRTTGLWLSEHAASYIGVDISARAVGEARALGLDARVIEDAVSLPFGDASFTVAVCIEVLEHVFQPYLVAREILRVLEPSGVLIVTVPNVAYWRRRLDLALFGRWNPVGDDLSVRQPWRDPHLRFFNRYSLKAMLLMSGFSPVRVGAHGGAFLRDIPVIRRLAAGREASGVYGGLENIWPGLLGSRLHAVAVKGPLQAPSIE